ncbi:hypothetical protein [Parachlamydia acanthamoebae]|uniref:hypothetical protein n=1 Tax=Parachlamydia acanthamoebae TaxID=83552 RepID=UPI0001C175A3|nr:hypothetical protein [Parachlamydia acanthamoebae]EFB40378.1 hypothetical protein pah_c205o006 [Parachlamydia acanthamoebae str. Hall's coccus]
MNPLQSSRETWNNDSFAFNGITLQHTHQEKNIPADTNEAIGHLYSIYECVDKIFALIKAESHSEKDLKDYLVKDLKHMEFLIEIIKKTYTDGEMQSWEEFVSKNLKAYEASPESPSISSRPPSSQQDIASEPIKERVMHVSGATNRKPVYAFFHEAQGNPVVQYKHSHGLNPYRVCKNFDKVLEAVRKCSEVGEETRERFPSAAENNLKLHNEFIQIVESKKRKYLERESNKAGKPKIEERSFKVKKQRVEPEKIQPTQ